MNGYDDGTFGADRPITRAEVVTIINRIFDSELDEEYFEKIDNRFKDIKKTDWFYKDVISASLTNEEEVSLILGEK
ncbi:MAG: S-layer homology domain-containing protein [Clostridia bacterium]|nr:S-layer homology domain-containing protein [Clostridia bacterium]